MSVSTWSFGTMAAAGNDSLAVSANTSNHSKARFSAGNVYSIIEFDTNGLEDANNTASSTIPNSGARGTWLDGGSSSDVWVQRVITSGTLNHADPGSGRLNLGISRQFGVTRSVQGTSTVDLDFNFYDAASGGNLLDSVSILMIVTVDAL